MEMSPNGRVSAVMAAQHEEGGWIFGVVAKRTYLVVSGRCEVHPEQIPLVEEAQLSEDGSELLHDSDLALRREQADVIVQGHAYPPSKLRAFQAGIHIGSTFNRRISVFGDRRLQRHAAGSLSFSLPEPCEKMPLSWKHAYGGVDRVLLAELGDPLLDLISTPEAPADPRLGLFGYPRNPAGRGYLIEPSPAAVEACELPNLEEPAQLLTPETIVRQDFMFWGRGPSVAGLGWLGYEYFPRSVQFGMPPPPYHTELLKPRDFLEVQLGCVKPASLAFDRPLVERIDPRFVQGSAVGMRMNEVSPSAEVVLENLHPSVPRWSFRLPSEVPRVAVKLPDAPAANLVPKIRTLAFEPDVDRVTIVWNAEMRLRLPLGPEQLEKTQHGVLWS